MKPCRVCHQATPISPSRIKTMNWICSPCANRESDKDDARYLARKVAAVLRRRNEQKPYPGTRLARQVLQRCNHKSTMSGEGNIRHLCMVQIDPLRPWTDEENVILVTSAEAYALSRATTRKGRQRMLQNCSKGV